MRKLLLMVLLAGLQQIQAASCGTLASPTACQITINDILFSVTNLTLANSVATGVTPLTASNVAVDITAAGSGMTLQFGAAGIPSFAVNSQESRGIIVSYVLTVSSALPGTAVLNSPVGLSFLAANAENGFAQVQFATSGGEGGCTVLVASPTNSCDLAPGAVSSVLGGNIMTLNGNAGNAAIGSFRNSWTATLTPSAPAVPEPSTMLLSGLGLAGFGWLARKRR